MKALKILTGIICNVFFLTSLCQAEPYAPLLDVSTTSDSYVKNKVKRAKVPPKNEVPVAAYNPASIFSVTEIDSSGNGKFQENRIILLATTDPEKSVLDFYKKDLSQWNYKVLKNTKIFLKKGEQYFWGGNKILEAPRVEVIDMTNSSAPPSVDTVKLKKSFPEIQTLIKIFYEKSLSQQIAVDVDKVLSGCLDYVTKEKRKMMGNGKKVEITIKKMAESSCQRVTRACDKGVEDRFCQRYARKYSQAN